MAKKQEEKEKLRIGFLAKFRLRRQIRKLKAISQKQREIVQKINETNAKLSNKQKEELEILREKMIIAIVGDGANEKGLAEIFEIKDENDKEITQKTLETASIEDLTELFDNLLGELSKEV